MGEIEEGRNISMNGNSTLAALRRGAQRYLTEQSSQADLPKVGSIFESPALRGDAESGLARTQRTRHDRGQALTFRSHKHHQPAGRKMELKIFIQQAIENIIDGVVAAQSSIKDKGAEINP